MPFQFLQFLDEMLFTNIDITGSILAFIFQHLAKDQTMQKKLRAEISTPRAQPGYTVGDYIGKQDTLLHFSLLESIHVTPAMCTFFICRSTQ